MDINNLPKQSELYNPVLQALHKLGGFASSAQIELEVIKLLNISEEQLAVKRNTQGRGNSSVLVHRIQWARTKLKAAGILGNPRRGYWQLTEKGRNENLDVDEIRRLTRRADTTRSEQKGNDRMLKDLLPSYKYMVKPTIETLRELGGAARKSEISSNVAIKLELTDEQLAIAYESGSTVYGGLMNDVRQFLLAEDIIEQPRRGYWQLTEKGWATEEFDATKANFAGPHRRKRRSKRQPENSPSETQSRRADLMSVDELVSSHTNWREQMIDALRQLPPERFERFLRIILQASGLQHIEIMRSDDSVCEGMAVTGGGLMSQTRVSFRCERESPQLVSEDVMNFRREVSATRAVKGMFIALGVFTNVAEAEAARIANPPLELIHGEKLVDILKKLGLGLKTEIVRVERVAIDSQFLASL